MDTGDMADEMTDLGSGDEDAIRSRRGNHCNHNNISGTSLAEQVQEALSLVPQSGISIESLPTEMQEKDLVASFVNAKCGCKLWNGSKCSLQFSKSDIESARLSCFALSHSELDMVVLGQIMAKSNTSSSISTTSRHLPASLHKKNTRSIFIKGRQYMPFHVSFLHAIGTMRLKNFSETLQTKWAYTSHPRKHQTASL